jgi:hypothetical protein
MSEKLNELLSELQLFLAVQLEYYRKRNSKSKYLPD